MTLEDQYMPLLQRAAKIIELREMAQSEDLPSEQQPDIIKAISHEKTNLSDKAYDLVRSKFSTEKSAEMVDLRLREEMSELKRTSHEEWGASIEVVEENIYHHFAAMKKQSPFMRKHGKFALLYALAAIALIFGGLKFYLLVPSPQNEIDTVAGLYERQAAYEKYVSYQKMANTNSRRGGFILQVLFWPAEPTDTEMDSASGFASISYAVYNNLVEEQVVCPVAGLSEPSFLTIAALVSDHMKKPEVMAEHDREDFYGLVAEPIIAKYPLCTP